MEDSNSQEQMMKVTRTIGLRGKRIDTLLTHTVAMPEANSLDVATMLPPARVLAKATNCPWARRLPGVGESNYSKGRSNHRTGSVAPKKSRRLNGPLTRMFHATDCWLAVVA
jgi:hypothetical protein